MTSPNPFPGWKSCALGEVIELKRGYDLPKRKRRAGSIPILSSSGYAGSHDEAKVCGPGVVTGRYGTVGEVFYTEGDFWPLNTALYVRDFKGSDPRFIAYLLETVDWQRYTDKAAVPGVNRNHVHLEDVVVPSTIEEQQRIAEILGAFDDKIELNRKMHRTLEAMAQALFKSWFVDFDGHDDLVDSELGPIPRSWKIERLQDHVDIEKGLSYKGKYLESDGTPLVNLNSVLEGGGWKESGLKFYSGPCKPRHEIAPGDLVVANTEQGHKYLLIGCPAIVPRRIGGQGIFTHHLYRVRTKPDSPLTTQFVYHLLLEPNFRRVVTSYTNGTTVNGLFKDGLRRPKIRVPSSGRAEEFGRIAVQLQSRREVAAEQSRTLADIRDALLPKLISGEIRVPEAEEVAEAVL